MEYSHCCSEKISRLGFGMMRLPTHLGGAIDEKAVFEMTDAALEGGINYFDTAYPYHGGMSEVMAGRALRRHPRKNYFLATKYPGHQYANEYNPGEIFEEQLKKCGVEYFDFYLLHNVCETSIGVYEDARWGIVDYFIKQRELGRIRHLGFSSHAEIPALTRFIDRFGSEMEFCQIQLNYLDWTLQKAAQKYELLTQRGMPIWVMEPVRGGRLARLSEAHEALLKARRPDASIASWAFRWLMGLPNVKVILSGMSSMEQMRDNLAVFSGGEPLSGEESALLGKIADEMHQIIPCTGCGYCLKECPRGLPIPELLSSLNDARFSKNSFTVGMKMESLPEDRLPTACIGCGACQRSCPQKIAIPEHMAAFAGMLSELPSWKKICEERARAAEKLKKTH